MQKWLTNQKFDSLKTSSVNNLISKIQWSKAHTVEADSSLLYYIVPVSLDTIPKFDDKTLMITKYLVLTKFNGNINNSRVIELFGEEKIIQNSYNKLIVDYNKSYQDNFTGIITIKSIYDSFKESKQYNSGILNLFRIIQAREAKNDKTILSGNKKTLSCTAWYDVTYRGDNMVSAQYLYTDCGAVFAGDECALRSVIDSKSTQSVRLLCGVGSGYGYGGGNPGNGGSNNGGGNGAPVSNTIPKDQLDIKVDSLLAKFPCAVRLIFEKLEGIKSFGTLLTPFITNQKPNITYTDKVLDWNPNGGG